jgi:hypothetical protein
MVTQALNPGLEHGANFKNRTHTGADFQPIEVFRHES